MPRPAAADLKICNRMSYVAEAAIAVQERGAAASRGWFRVDPGQCRSVLQGALTANEIFIHTRVNAVYGPSPAAQTGDVDFCVADGNFVIGGARSCRGGQTIGPLQRGETVRQRRRSGHHAGRGRRV